MAVPAHYTTKTGGCGVSGQVSAAISRLRRSSGLSAQLLQQLPQARKKPHDEQHVSLYRNVALDQLLRGIPIGQGRPAFDAVFGRRVMRNRSPVAATALSNFISLPLIAAAAALELQYIPVNLRMETIAAIAHICVVPTIIGYWSWNRGVTTLGAGGAMVFYNTLPLYGALLGAALLGEPLSIIHYLFGGMIIAGGLWATLGRQSQRS